MKPKRITGFNNHRITRKDPYNQKEELFVDIANRYAGSDPNFLARIVTHGDRPDYLTKREEMIIMSVIQWLGTPVGQGFLEQVESIHKKENG